MLHLPGRLYKIVAHLTRQKNFTRREMRKIFIGREATGDGGIF